MGLIYPVGANPTHYLEFLIEVPTNLFNSYMILKIVIV